MPYTIATVLINEFGETIADTPINAIPKTLVVLENGTFAALIMGSTEAEMGTTTLRLSGSLEPVSDRWAYVGSTAHGMGVWHLWYDIQHSDRQVEAEIYKQEQLLRERNANTERQVTGTKTEATSKGKAASDQADSGTGDGDNPGADTDTDRDDGTTPADSD